MDNFLNFIEEDIETKKTLLSTMPTNTKTDIKKFNEKITTIFGKYYDYKNRVKKYIDTKSKSFNVKGNCKNIESLNKTISDLEHVRFILNPTNTFFEKMGFDNLLYQINNYYDFNFSSLNDIINQFLDKFELAGISLTSNDFDYTFYVREYMTSFLEARDKKNDNSIVSEVFEKIYWVNPDIIGHIELNFRKLIKKHSKKFNNYVEKIGREVLVENNIINYEDCLDKLKATYIELNTLDREDICDIINSAKSGQIDISSYFNDSKIRTGAYTSLMIDSVNLDDQVVMDRFYDNLEKLKNTLVEYDNYIKFLPLINDFKNEYQKLIVNNEKGSNQSSPDKGLDNIESEIEHKEAKLEKINKKIFSGKTGFFAFKNESNLKQLKIDSIKQAKELYELYKIFDKECFKNKVTSILNSSLTIAELLHLYYSFDYFKKIAIKKVFNITNYDEIIKYSDNFDLFAMNPTNIITNGICLFEESNITKIIMNKYRLDNINLTEENLNPDDLKSLIDKIDFLLRIDKIEKSSTTVEKIWFMVQVEKYSKQENKKV